MKYVEIRKNTNDAMKLVIDTDKRKLGKQMRLYSLVGLMHIDPCNVIANTLSIPPREYIRKNDIQRIDGTRTSGESCGLIRSKARTLQGLTCN